MKNLSIVQTVVVEHNRARYTQTCTRWPRAKSPDEAMALMLRLWAPGVWR